MNDHQLKSFVLVADAGSMTQAATQLFISIQALRQQIGILENEIGVKLFSRDSKGMSLTPAGKLFYERAVQITGLIDDGIIEARKTATPQEEPVLRVGFVTNPIIQPILILSDLFGTRHPNIRQELIPVSHASQDLFKYLEEGELDVFEYPEIRNISSHFEFTRIRSSATICLMSPDHRLASNESVSTADLRDERVLIRNKKVHPLLMEYLARADVHIKVEDWMKTHQYEYHASGMQEIIDCCLSGSVFFAPEEYASHFSTLVKKRLSIDIPWSYGLYYMRESSTAARAFVETAREVFTETVMFQHDSAEHCSGQTARRE
ncbi:MAG: LysR family transcriptional regulator [Coriobacteriia bacterium]